MERLPPWGVDALRDPGGAMRRLAVISLTLIAAAGLAAAQPKPGTPAPPPPAPPAAEPPAAEPPEAGEPDVDALRQEYLKLRDELFASRARAATVASQLYSTKITLRLTYTTGRMYGVSRASIRLDGASVYDQTDGSIATDDGIRFEGYIAPGRHVLTYRVEASGKDDPRFTTAVESTVVVQAVAGKDLVVAARASDDGDIAYGWKKKEAGTYRLGLDVNVKSLARPKTASGKAGGATASR
jgi:hypothetical protein